MNEIGSNSIAPTEQKVPPIAPAQQAGFGRIGIIIQISLATLVLVMLFVMFWMSHDALGLSSPKLQSIPEQLTYTVKFQIFSVLPMVASLNHVMLSRFFISAARNPLGGAADAHVAKANRILVNTTEQLVLSFLNLIIYSTVVTSDCLFVVPFVVACFLLGRILFFTGYMIHPKYRIFGLMFSFEPMMALFGFNLVKVCCIM